MEMVTAMHILLSKIYIVQVSLLRSLNASGTTKNMSVRGSLIWKKKTEKNWEEKENSLILK